jgi:NAD+--asparagine ADP-ribosyltransferase
MRKEWRETNKSRWINYCKQGFSLIKRETTKEVEVKDEEEAEVEAMDKVKMIKEVTTRTTIHAVEDAIVEEAADQIGTMFIVIIMVNMVIMQVNVIPRRRWRRMLIL